MAETMVTSVNDNILLPLRCRNRRLFLELFTLSGVLSAAFYLFKCLALATDDIAAADLYLSLHDMNMRGIPDFMVTWLESDHHQLLPLAYLVAGIAVGSMIYIATISAAVACYDSRQEEEEEHEEEKQDVMIPDQDSRAQGSAADRDAVNEDRTGDSVPVGVPAVSDGLQEKQRRKAEAAQAQVQPRRSKRGPVPSTRYAGRDWTR